MFKEMCDSKTIGQTHKKQSDIVMESTWDRDISTRTAYLYDFFHDKDPYLLTDTKADRDIEKIPVSIKYLENSAQTYAKDTITYHLELRPFQKCNVPYYNEFFGRFRGVFPVGLYADIPDREGVFNRWLVVGLAQYYSPQFPTFEILPCDYTFNWVWDDKKIAMAGTTRTQSSYTSGEWTSDKFTVGNDTMKWTLPLNNRTIHLFHNQRMIIDTRIDVNNGEVPRVFSISKVNRLEAPGIVMFTGRQDLYDPTRDYVEYEVEGDPNTIKGMYADYFGSASVPKDEDPFKPIKTIKIAYTGISSTIKVGGNPKILTAEFYRNDERIDSKDGVWTFDLDGEDASSIIQCDSDGLESYQIRISVPKENLLGESAVDYIGSVLNITYTSEDGLTGSIAMNIIGL
jgi:hypothetical protein